MSVPTIDAYGHTVTFFNDGTNDYYIIGGSVTYIFPKGTPSANALISTTIQQNLAIAKQQVQDYIQSKYSRDQQIQLLMLYLAAQSDSLSNRQAYIGQLLTWLNGIISVLSSYVDSVQAMTDTSVISATTIDVTLFPADPGVTMLSAIQIVN